MTSSTTLSGTKAGLGRAAAVLGMVALLAAAARVQVPMYPVPMTLQSLAVLLLALTLGPRMASAGVASWLILGFAGAPVFASGGGPAYLASPTAGYLFGFLAAALTTGHIAARIGGWAGRILGVAVGTVMIYAVGLPWLGAVIGSEAALRAGLQPFLVGDAVKALIAILLHAGIVSIHRSISGGPQA